MTWGERAEFGVSIRCTDHDQPFDECPCPRGEGAWLEYRRMRNEIRAAYDRVIAERDAARAEVARLTAENERLRVELALVASKEGR